MDTAPYFFNSNDEITMRCTSLLPPRLARLRS